MSFQFNFTFHDGDTTSVDSSEDTCDLVGTSEKTDNRTEAAKEIPPVVSLDVLESEFEVVSVCKGVQIHCLTSSSVVESIIATNEENCIKKSVAKHSDLIPNVYEGGLKVWECSIDLVEYLYEARVPLEGLNILELGCGAGLPGIFALQQKACHVCFQDFNEEVLSYLTIPNISLNLESKELGKTCQFISGGWGQISEDLIPPSRYDIILTAETIYSPESVPHLYQLMKRALKPNGTIYLAAKTHYFGVGGGTRLFEEYVKNQDDFSIDPCKTITEGVQREILTMRRKHKEVTP